jgi:hypothetical protein
LLGVYVLGAIDPAERARVDAHLGGCPDCREELAGLAGLPALLGHVPVAEAARVSGIDDGERLAPGQGMPGPEGAGGTLTPLLARMAHRRKVSRWRSLAAAAAVVVIAAGAATGAISLTGSGSGSGSGTAPAGEAGHWEQVQATDPATLAHVAVRYEAKDWGTVMDASVTGIPAGTTCQLWVLGRDGHKWAAGGWMVTNPYEQTTYPASSPIQGSAVRGFEVTTGHTVLVRVTTPA